MLFSTGEDGVCDLETQHESSLAELVGKGQELGVIGRGSKEDIRTRCLEGYVEEDGLDFIAWISLGKCASLVLLYTEQFVLFYGH